MVLNKFVYLLNFEDWKFGNNVIIVRTEKFAKICKFSAKSTKKTEKIVRKLQYFFHKYMVNKYLHSV